MPARIFILFNCQTTVIYSIDYSNTFYYTCKNKILFSKKVDNNFV